MPRAVMSIAIRSISVRPRASLPMPGVSRRRARRSSPQAPKRTGGWHYRAGAGRCPPDVSGRAVAGLIRSIGTPADSKARVISFADSASTYQTHTSSAPASKVVTACAVTAVTPGQYRSTRKVATGRSVVQRGEDALDRVDHDRRLVVLDLVVAVGHRHEGAHGRFGGKRLLPIEPDLVEDRHEIGREIGPARARVRSAE